MRILLTGATGLIGKELGLELVRRGHTVVVVSRKPDEAKRICPFPCESVGWTDLALTGAVEVVVNLAGEAVAEHRWTAEVKKKILASRLSATDAVVKFAAATPSVKAVVSASAIGFYGNRHDESLDERSEAGPGFLADVCQKWEQALFAPSLPDRIRRVAIRVGVVLSSSGGALEKMVPLFDKGIGGPIGLEKLWLSWIHEKDIVQLFCWAVESERAKGIYNGVSGRPSTNRQFARVLAHALGARSKIPVPALFLKAAMGEMSEVVLQSQKIGESRAVAESFQFRFKDLDSAFRDLFPRGTEHESLLIAKQWVPRSPEQIFSFFSDATNLERLTPSFLKFKVLGKPPRPLESGSEIRYRLTVHGMPIKWLTEIRDWKPPHVFVDHQKKGPYDLWTHTHFFEEFAGGTLLTDEVRYRLPLGWLGRAGGGDIVRKDIRNIFNYRHAQIAELFGEVSS